MKQTKNRVVVISLVCRGYPMCIVKQRAGIMIFVVLFHGDNKADISNFTCNTKLFIRYL